MNVPIRAELIDSHRQTLERWAMPGSFWTATERLAIVAEVRRALDAPQTPPWATPPPAAPATAALLPDAAVAAVWRLTNHPATLTHGWHEQLVAGDGSLTAGAYVELVALVAQANCVDRFTDALDLPRYELPPAQAGAAVPATADDAAVRDHWVPTAAMRGPNVVKALSLLPFENETRRLLSNAHYVPDAALLGDLRHGNGALTRPQIELIAARTSTLNECFY